MFRCAEHGGQGHGHDHQEVPDGGAPLLEEQVCEHSKGCGELPEAVLRAAHRPHALRGRDGRGRVAPRDGVKRHGEKMDGQPLATVEVKNGAETCFFVIVCYTELAYNNDWIRYNSN